MIKQLSVFVENKPGRLAEVTGAIGAAGVDIRALCVADTSDFGILRLIVDRPEEAAMILKEAGAAVSLTDVVAVGMDDKPGSFSSVVRLLSDSGINIEYMYAFVSRKASDAFLILRIEEPERGAEILRKNGVRLLTSEEVYHI